MVKRLSGRSFNITEEMYTLDTVQVVDYYYCELCWGRGCEYPEPTKPMIQWVHIRPDSSYGHKHICEECLEKCLNKLKEHKRRNSNSIQESEATGIFSCSSG